MSTSSRRLSAKSKAGKASHTPGREKGATCQKSALKTWGAHANPYKLKGGQLDKWQSYEALVYGMNQQRKPGD